LKDYLGVTEKQIENREIKLVEMVKKLEAEETDE